MPFLLDSPATPKKKKICSCLRSRSLPSNTSGLCILFPKDRIVMVSTAQHPQSDVVLPVKYGVISSLHAAGQIPNLPENPCLPSCKTYSLVLYNTYLAWCLSVRFPRSICNKWQSRHYHCTYTELNSFYTTPASYVVTTDWYRVRIYTIAGTVADMGSRVIIGVVVNTAAGLGVGAGLCEYEVKFLTINIVF
jgi:hypothetical protein